MEKPTQKQPEAKQKSDRGFGIRVTSRTRELLTEILRKANSKEQGRAIKAAEVIALALSLVTEKQIQGLQEASLTNADRLDLNYQKYIRENSYVSKDDFLGQLLKGALKLEGE